MSTYKTHNWSATIDHRYLKDNIAGQEEARKIVGTIVKRGNINTPNPWLG